MYGASVELGEVPRGDMTSEARGSRKAGRIIQRRGSWGVG